LSGVSCQQARLCAAYSYVALKLCLYNVDDISAESPSCHGDVSRAQVIRSMPVAEQLSLFAGDRRRIDWLFLVARSPDVLAMSSGRSPGWRSGPLHCTVGTKNLGSPLVPRPLAIITRPIVRNTSVSPPPPQRFVNLFKGTDSSSYIFSVLYWILPAFISLPTNIAWNTYACSRTIDIVNLWQLR